MIQISSHVATLVSAPSHLAADLVGRVAATLPLAGAPRWLSPSTAADIPFASPLPVDNVQWCQVVRAALGDAPVDVVVQPAIGRRKRLLVADMDSTLIEEECIDEMAEALSLRAAVAALTVRSTRGEVDFANSLVERVAMLRGLAVNSVEEIAARATPVPGAQVLVSTMRARGAVTAIASGGFTLVTGPIAARLGFDRHFSNMLEVAEERLTGTMRLPLFTPESKRATLRALCDELDLSSGETMAVGDGANDIPMLQAAGLGIAFRAKPIVAAAVGTRIDHADLTALLYVQGYAAEEFAT